jgi:hypothetical protein
MMRSKWDFFRFPWESFPDCIIHADEKRVRGHASYHAAKTGDSDAAFELARTFLNDHCLAQIKQLEEMKQDSITLVSAHALEREGVNAIPEAIAELLGERLGWDVEHQVVQTNIVSHTKADGFSRLAKQAAFEGTVEAGRNYFLVDDFIGQGGTLANLRGWILHCGGRVLGATVLTGKTYSARLKVDPIQINELENTHGKELRKWWQSRFGFDYDCLTSSEARYLINTPSADRIRDRIVAAVQERSG